MNLEDDSLKRKLECFRLPPQAEEKREAALSLGLQSLASASPPPRAQAFARRALWFVATAACLFVVGLFLRFPRGSHEVVVGSFSQQPLPHDLFAEIDSLFPRQLIAVIAEQGNVAVKLAESPFEIPDDQRLKITLWRGDRVCTIDTFSGTSVYLDFAGESFCVTPLIQGDGTPFVLLNDRVVPSNGPLPDGMRISTQIRGGLSS
jgi:hypothetical protein